MDLERCLAILFAYPVIEMTVIDWALVWPRRGVNNERLPLTDETRARMDVVGRRLTLFHLFILLALLWVTNRSVLATLSASALTHIPSAVVTGLAIGAALLLASRLFSPINGNFASGPTGLWMAIFVVGAFVEEIWRAICIVCLTDVGWNAPTTALLTGFVFAVAHLAGRPSRILAAGMIYEVVVGFALAVCFVRTESLVAPIVASLLYFPASFLVARKNLARFTETA
jgi:hypothetical protein